MYHFAHSQAQYPDVYRHWSASSETYAGGDALLTKINQGWKVSDTIYREENWLLGSRLVLVFHFDLTRGEEKLAMPVLNNPFVTRLIYQEKLVVKPMEARPVVLPRLSYSAPTSIKSTAELRKVI